MEVPQPSAQAACCTRFSKPSRSHSLAAFPSVERLSRDHTSQTCLHAFHILFTHCRGHNWDRQANQLRLQRVWCVLTQVKRLKLLSLPNPNLIQAAMRGGQNAIACELDTQPAIDRRIGVASTAAVANHCVFGHIRLDRSGANVRDRHTCLEAGLLDAQRVEPPHHGVLRATIQRAQRNAELAREARDVDDLPALAFMHGGQQSFSQRHCAQEIDLHHLDILLNPGGVHCQGPGRVASVIH
mmetsp:Transcript_41398/g.114095  ORF Transcript_41398/g.114095 Transcript_41398/m.114095 type:complete len:241 (+) Transcript_41398:140-862(+)